MVQGGQRSSLSPKPVAVLEIRSVRMRHELQRNIAAEHWCRAPDRPTPIPPSPIFSMMRVLAEQIAGLNGHDPILLPPSLACESYGVD